MSPAAPERPSRLPWWAMIAVLFALYQLFEFLRAQVVGRGVIAQHHARLIVEIERWARIFPEQRINAFVSAHKSLAQAMDIYYGTVHFVIPPLVLVWLWRRHPAAFARWRDVLMAVSVVGLVLFAVYPLAPPRLTVGAGTHFIDTAVRFGGLGPLDRGNFVDKNPYAAMPSLHVAWSSWCAWAVVATATPRIRWSRWLAVIYPLTTTAVVVGTANHWILDAVAGVGLLGVGVALFRPATLRRATTPGSSLRSSDQPISTSGAPCGW